MKTLSFEIKKEIRLKELIMELSNSFGVEFEKFILNEEENKINPFILILVNDISIDLLQNLNTILHNNDEVTFLPSIHGGI